LGLCTGYMVMINTMGKKSGSVPWWREAVFYQIYPWSFKDSNGDGIGDLEGIRSKLDYLEWLGVDALWLSPFFSSPMRDLGYDVADYRAVDSRFGSMDDFIALMHEAKAKGIRVILDLVANHSSDEHPWFLDARSSRQSARHDWYLWVPDTGKPPNNWKALFELGSAWHPNAATGERYLGTFTRHQPEFNWRNPSLRKEIYDTMMYWYSQGADGFRMDVATAYTKDPELRSNPLSFVAVPDFFQRHIHDRNHPDFHEIFREMRSLADTGISESPEASKPGERCLIAEPHGQSVELAASCYGKADDELHMAFNFDFLAQPWNAQAFRASVERWLSCLPEWACPVFTLSNHDKPRHIWRYRASSKTVTLMRAKAAAALLLCLKGTPFLYYGEEIGMSCHRLAKKDLRDPLGIATWPLGFLGRDPERRPMQWDSGHDGGFGSDTPWLPLDPEWRECNVAAQRGQADSLLEWYRSLLALRRKTAALRRGTQRFIDCPSGIMAWERILSGQSDKADSEQTSGGSQSILVYLNFLSKPIKTSNDQPLRVLLSSSRESGSILPAASFVLGSNEALIAETLG